MVNFKFKCYEKKSFNMSPILRLLVSNFLGTLLYVAIRFFLDNINGKKREISDYVIMALVFFVIMTTVLFIVNKRNKKQRLKWEFVL